MYLIRRNDKVNPIERMDAKASTFTNKEKIIYDLLINYPDEILHGDINSWSLKYNVSQSTLTRFCQKIGYKGFNEFKFAYFRYEKSKVITYNQDNDEKDILDSYSKLILLIRDIVPESQIETIAEKIFKSNTVYTFGAHKSSLPARMLEINLLKLSKKSSFISSDIFQELENVVSKDDLIVIFTAKGGAINTNLKDTLDYLKDENRLNLIVITFDDKNILKNKASEFVWLPSSSNQNYKVYLENQIIFLLYVDLLTKKVAQLR